MMDTGTMVIGIFSILLAVLSLVQAWALFIIKGLQSADVRLGEELAAIRVLVAGSYLTRAEFGETMRLQTDAILRAIDKLDREMDRKVDK